MKLYLNYLKHKKILRYNLCHLNRYRFNSGPLMQQVRNVLKWADGKAIKNEFDIQLLDLLGPKVDADLTSIPKQVKQLKDKQTKAKKPKVAKEGELHIELLLKKIFWMFYVQRMINKFSEQKEALNAEKGEAQTISELMKTKIHFHKPGENYKTDGYIVTPNTHRLLQKHLKATGGKVVTRFPPEPNGILHIGHARAIIQNFELAKHFGGITNLRYDDTNPSKEEVKYVKAIEDDIKWLGYKPKNVFFASDYFDEMYNYAIVLIKKGLAYVDDLSPEEIAKNRGNLNEPGINSIYRNRSVEENLALFQKMKDGVFADKKCVLRAKIDMKSPNLNLRDPIIYRILYENHHRAGDKWCIYPMYDFAHPLEDAIEGVTHSLCSLEFEDHRPLYDWVIKNTEIKNVPRQIEFGRLSIENTIMSKRYLLELVNNKKVIGWDDPRMPTLSGLRRRGYTPDAIKNFILSTGLSKNNSIINNSMLGSALKDDLKLKAKRIMGIIDPLKVIIDNYPEDQIEEIDVLYNAENESLGSRKIIFSKEIYIEKEDFAIEKPNKNYKRLALGVEVRLFHAYFIKAVSVKKDENGNIIEVHATYDVKTKSGSNFNERKPNGTIHFLSSKNLKNVEYNFFGPMILDNLNGSLLEKFNENSWIKKNGFVENKIDKFNINEKFQLVRNGFFNIDQDSKEDRLILNEIVPLKKSY